MFWRSAKIARASNADSSPLARYGACDGLEMFASLLSLVLAADPDAAAVMELRGHSGEQVHQALESALPGLPACLRPAPVPPRRGERPPPPVIVLPSTQELVLSVSRAGAVAQAEVKGPGRLDEPCAAALLRKLEFGRSPGSASVTVVRVPVTCDLTSCRYPWTPKP